jgi:hypothetical protein
MLTCYDLPRTAHNSGVRKAFAALGITKSHTTHAGRVTAARDATAFNATESDTKAHGGWNEQGSFRACYQRELPVSAMLALAGFDGRHMERYWVPRTLIGDILDLCFRFRILLF